MERLFEETDDRFTFGLSLGKGGQSGEPIQDTT